jgi:LAO/AO transport system kinase
VRIGISGTPGVGKSTFIEAFGTMLTDAGHRVAVLAVDPTSSLTGGAILGDKTRMERLARDPQAFVRPSPAGGTLGGVARRTREAMLLCEAAGFDVCIVETVGVGQSETAVADMVDCFCVLLAPAGGDELQGIKRGITELADVIVINKADGALRPIAELAAAEYRAAIGLLRHRTSVWEPQVLLASALHGDGVDGLWETVRDFDERLRSAGELQRRRGAQATAWMWSEVHEQLQSALRDDPAVAAEVARVTAAVADGSVTPTAAAHRLLDVFRSGT